MIKVISKILSVHLIPYVVVCSCWDCRVRRKWLPVACNLSTNHFCKMNSKQLFNICSKPLPMRLSALSIISIASSSIKMPTPACSKLQKKALRPWVTRCSNELCSYRRTGQPDDCDLLHPDQQ